MEIKQKGLEEAFPLRFSVEIKQKGLEGAFTEV